MSKFQPTLPRKSLVTIYKPLFRRHLDYGDVINDRASIKSFHQSVESLQYSAAIVITGAIRGTSSEKIFPELCLETLKSRRWLSQLCLLYKLTKEKSPVYLFQLIPEKNTPYTTRSVQKSQIPFFKTKINFFKNCFFPAVILEWNKFDVNILYSASCDVFKRVIPKFIRPEPIQMFNVDISEGSKFLTRIRLGLSHLADHKFRHSFQDCVNPVCSCG